MTDNSFFDESLEQSKVKAEIVAKYFWAWAKIIIPTVKNTYKRIAYIDLFAGPGRYKDQTKSTPILVLEKALSDSDMRNMLVTMFNDANSSNTQSLQEAINQIPDINLLKYPPVVYNYEVGSNMVGMFEDKRLIPTLFFVDPWGYKGLSLRLINSVLKDWGCDCIFFFNYNRISMGLSNEKVQSHMDALFGEERAAQLRIKIDNVRPYERELTIVNEIAQALRDMGGTYVLPFRFRNEAGTRTSHHLIFVSKHFRGYDVMKGVMAKGSSNINDGVPSFEYNPATERQGLLFQFNRPLEDLKGLILKYFKGRTLSMEEIYQEHSVDTPYISKNYKDVLLQLEEEGQITVTRPSGKKRIKGKFPDDLVVTFP